MATDLHVVAQGKGDLLNLVGELAGRRQDQPLACLEVDIEALQHADDERGSLAGSRLCLADRVAAVEEG
eukprot:CAMPEP_0183542490 /NCGR_PEP_ID=MMETSP0371-20130417/42420_1 /TAXON_ID=268820 /ORGANISM="Peridinium aciculiferum, Strain PAER-2" /LENGTH=68 /DNA_ID=CAMNT_0025743749 /DNA_START=27 /DNA_END=230 /DNA_ORIENTATION=-